MHDIDSAPIPPVGSVYRCAIPLRWGDLDALNHVNNTVYFRYFEEARVQMMARAGVAVSPDKMCVLAHTSCDFLKPLHYPAIAVVSQVLLRLGRSSIEMEVRLEREDEPGVFYAKGRYVLVYADSASGKSIPWSAAELGALAAVLKA